MPRPLTAWSRSRSGKISTRVTQIPRPSHHEEQVSAFLAQFGEDLGLETIVDDVGNVIIRKPATKGMEDRQGVVLQAHMDMVAQKTSDSTHDFLTDPIDAYVEDGWVKAVDTTLGADDGSGVAMIMTLLQEDDIAHGPLEGLFTVNEEDGFTGVNALQPGVLQGTILINVDSEKTGVFTIGSAGGVYTDITAQYELEETPADYVGYTVEISGLQGGHSGMRYCEKSRQCEPPACAAVVVGRRPIWAAGGQHRRRRR